MTSGSAAMSKGAEALAFLQAFVRARYRWRRGTREGLAAWQRRQLTRFSQSTLSGIPFYAGRVRAAQDGEAAVSRERVGRHDHAARGAGGVQTHGDSGRTVPRDPV